MTKSELREMIRECLREELAKNQLTENAEELAVILIGNRQNRKAILSKLTEPRHEIVVSVRDFIRQYDNMKYDGLEKGIVKFYADAEGMQELKDTLAEVPAHISEPILKVTTLLEGAKCGTKKEAIVEGRQINFDDDLVVVYKDGKEIYKGLEDYEPMKREPWEWDDREQAYFLNGKYKKVCLEAFDEDTLTESTLTAEEKVDAWHAGTRRENYKAAGIPKLNTFLEIAKRKGYTEIVDIIEKELIARKAKEIFKSKIHDGTVGFRADGTFGPLKSTEPEEKTSAETAAMDWEDRVKAADKLLDELIEVSDNLDYDLGDGYWYTEYTRWCNRYLYRKNYLENPDTLKKLCLEYSEKMPGLYFYYTEDDLFMGELIEDPISEIGYILSTDEEEDKDFVFLK